MAPLVHIVDDDAQVRAATSYLLSSHGYATETYSGGAEFLEARRFAATPVRAGASPDEALADTTGRLAALTPDSRLNFLLTDGRSIAATAWGDTLWYLAEPGRSLVVASEPYDDDPRWLAVPDRSLIVAAPGAALVISPL